MKILYLGYDDAPLISTLQQAGHDVTVRQDKLCPEDVAAGGFAFLVSYGYRHILKPAILELFPGRAINLHISYLPWNRGAHPNLWSVLDGTPSGVTIHYLDAGVDTGDIIAQKRVELDSSHTLSSSYAVLHQEIQQLFQEVWPLIERGENARTPQPPGGSHHYVRDFGAVEHLLVNGWETPLATLRKLNHV